MDILDILLKPPQPLMGLFLVYKRLSAMHYHIPVTRIFSSKFLACPHSSISGMWSGVRPPIKIWSALSTLDLSLSGVPPPPTYQNENLVRTCHFRFELV